MSLRRDQLNTISHQEDYLFTNKDDQRTRENPSVQNVHSIRYSHNSISKIMNKTGMGLNMLRSSIQESMSAQSRAVDVNRSYNVKDHMSTRRSLASRLQDITIQSPPPMPPSNAATSTMDRYANSTTNHNFMKATRNNFNQAS